MFITILNFYFEFFRFPFFRINLREAVPEQSSLVIEANDIASLNKTSPNSSFWSSVQQTSLFQKIQTDLFEFKSRLLENQDSSSFSKLKFIAALQTSSAKSADFLYIIKADGKQKKLSALIDQLENVKINRSVFLKEHVYELIFADNQSFTVSFCKNVVLFSRYPFMVEDGISQLNKNKKDSSISKVFRASKRSDLGKPAISFYFNFKKILQLLDRPGRKLKSGQIDPGSFATLNLYAKDEDILIDGTMFTGHKTEVKPRSFSASFSELNAVIPDNCSFVFWQSSNIEKREHFDKKNDPEFENFLSPWIGEESAIFLMESQKGSPEEDRLTIFKSKDVELAKNYLNEYAEVKGKLYEFDYQTFTIKQFFSDEILNPNLLLESIPIQSPYYTIINDFLIFARTRQSLEMLIDKHILGQTLENDPSFLQFQNELEPSSNAYLYCNVSLLLPLLRQFSSTLELENVEPYFDLLYPFQSIGVQIQQSSGKSNLQFYLNSSDDAVNPTKLVWTSQLSANAIMPPTILKNSKTDQNEVFIQDAENRIYLFDRNGNIKWNRKLKLPILSKIYQIQYYESGENHILFNTKDQIFVVDHNGKDVGVYPLNLPSPATNGLCLIDFENDKQYSFFIGTKNDCIYAFKKTGEPIEGWNPRKNAGNLSHDIRHFQVDGSDYILALNDSGDLHAFKRNGEKRFETVSFDSKYLTPPYFQVLNNRARIVLGNQSGKAQVINAKGKHFNLYVGTGGDKKVKFLFADVVGDKRKDYITLSGSDLSCHYYEKSEFKKAFSFQFEGVQDELFAIQRQGHEKLQIGTLNKTNRRINLLKNDGSLSDGFPLAGTTNFSVVDLFDTKQMILIVALDDSIYSCKIE